MWVRVNDQKEAKELIPCINKLGGPKVQTSMLAGAGMGLFAERSYEKDEIITTYEGLPSKEFLKGDYVLGLEGIRTRKFAGIHINAEFEFPLGAKGRWINQCKSRVNVGWKLSKDEYGNIVASEFKSPIVVVYAKRYVEKDSEFYIDYGNEYQIIE